MSTCERINNWFGKCNFEPRYHIKKPTMVLESKLDSQWALSEADKDRLMIEKTYVHDICVTCGKIVTPIES